VADDRRSRQRAGDDAVELARRPCQMNDVAPVDAPEPTAGISSTEGASRAGRREAETDGRPTSPVIAVIAQSACSFSGGGGGVIQQRPFAPGPLRCPCAHARRPMWKRSRSMPRIR
jgi:hypothetical protein